MDKKLGEQAKRPMDKKLGEQAKRPMDKKSGSAEQLFVSERLAIEKALDEALHARIASALQFELGTPDGVLLSIAVGRTAFDELAPAQPIEQDTPFDVASVTKAACTSLLCLLAFQEGKLALASTLAECLPNVPADKAQLCIADLLSHRSGLPAWQPFFERVPPTLLGSDKALRHIREAVLETPLESSAGIERYSDLGYILLHWVLERAFAAPLDELFTQRLAAPLGLTHSRFVRHGSRLDGAPATEYCALRKGFVQGVVHDENTWAMGGVSGHAGLFSTASDLGCVARALLNCDANPACDTLFSHQMLRTMWEPIQGGSYCLGWDSPSSASSNAGPGHRPRDVRGHLGFTGCSLWMRRSSHPKPGYVVLLSNRVHPSRDEARIRALRVAVHELAWRLLERH
ncbi:MAG: serine hydrolase domain-containing protein [Myxococcota bacterium]|jgi:CubicO group peptidase (beta-lactamase class C family)|nr:serine hydrolase domain-containing protein [Myxococcota bacterium]